MHFLLSSENTLYVAGMARETVSGKGVLHSVLEQNGKYCSTKSMKWMSQWDLCVHDCSPKVQQWSSTPNGIRSLARSTLKSSLLYIKHHVSEIHLDSYTFFYFFP